MVSRRTFLLGAGAFAVSPSLPAMPTPEPLTYCGIPIVWDPAPSPMTVGGIDRAMNEWWISTPQMTQAIARVNPQFKALFDQCVRENK